VDALYDMGMPKERLPPCVLQAQARQEQMRDIADHAQQVREAKPGGLSSGRVVSDFLTGSRVRG
jgi:hypothetical protein